jgi:hypothetical protein
MLTRSVSDLGPIPSRLKCSICSKLAQDPYRLPCCEKSVCSSCTIKTLQEIADSKGHSSLPETCPLCDHHPLHSQDCSENVSLRKTIQVFLRHAEHKEKSNQVTSFLDRLTEGFADTSVGWRVGCRRVIRKSYYYRQQRSLWTRTVHGRTSWSVYFFFF